MHMLLEAALVAFVLFAFSTYLTHVTHSSGTTRAVARGEDKAVCAWSSGVTAYLRGVQNTTFLFCLFHALVLFLPKLYGFSFFINKPWGIFRLPPRFGFISKLGQGSSQRRMSDEVMIFNISRFQLAYVFGTAAIYATNIEINRAVHFLFRS
jgi:hypothetical protein